MGAGACAVAQVGAAPTSAPVGAGLATLAPPPRGQTPRQDRFAGGRVSQAYTACRTGTSRGVDRICLDWARNVADAPPVSNRRRRAAWAGYAPTSTTGLRSGLVIRQRQRSTILGTALDPQQPSREPHYAPHAARVHHCHRPGRKRACPIFHLQGRHGADRCERTAHVRHARRPATRVLRSSGAFFARPGFKLGAWRSGYGWRSWSGVGQQQLKGLSLPGRPLLWHDEARRVHDRDSGEGGRRARCGWEGVFLILPCRTRNATCRCGVDHSACRCGRDASSPAASRVASQHGRGGLHIRFGRHTLTRIGGHRPIGRWSLCHGPGSQTLRVLSATRPNLQSR